MFFFFVFFFFCLFFFFQAEDGIRDHCVTGVQTCALPISSTIDKSSSKKTSNETEVKYITRVITMPDGTVVKEQEQVNRKIGRASCRERV